MNISLNNRISFGQGYLASSGAADTLKKQSVSHRKEIVEALKSAKDSKYYDLYYTEQDRLFIKNKENGRLYYTSPSSYEKVSSTKSVKAVVYNRTEPETIPLIDGVFDNFPAGSNVENNVENARYIFHALEASRQTTAPLDREIDNLPISSLSK